MRRSSTGAPSQDRLGALHGLRVVDLSTVILGPWAAQILGDMGADVIKVETPQGDSTRQIGPCRNSGMASFYMAANRNKRSVVLDITQPQGLQALYRLIGTADVLLHNLRPRVSAKLGLDYASLAEGFPDLVYCATYGFSNDGPLADKPAYDDIIQAASGLADLLGSTVDQPRYVPTVMADKTTSYNVVATILAALLHRARGGRGQELEVPMFETVVDFLMVEHLYGATFDPPVGELGYNRILNKGRRPYATRDGYLSVLPYSDDNWRALFALAGRPEQIEDPRFSTLSARIDNADAVYDALAEILVARTSAEWQELLEAAGVPVSPVNSKESLLDNRQLAGSGFWTMMDHPTEGRVRMPNPPARFSESPSSIRRLQPRLGEHSVEVLSEIGYSGAEIEQLFRAGVSIDGESLKHGPGTDF
jgi:crotonobetainyl-CoA:carnitine CoA-transferase CaiB-like acyl-CoA transferase